MPYIKRLAIGIAILTIVALAAFVGVYACAIMFVPWSMLHSFEAEFDELPANDRALEIAIEQVDGVIEGSAEVIRYEDDGIRITFGTGGPLWDRPPLPNLPVLTSQHGYDGRVGEFKEIDPATD